MLSSTISGNDGIFATSTTFGYKQLAVYYLLYPRLIYFWRRLEDEFETTIRQLSRLHWSVVANIHTGFSFMLRAFWLSSSRDSHAILY